MTSGTRSRDASLGLRLLGAVVLAVMAGALVYTLAIAFANFSRIGV